MYLKLEAFDPAGRSVVLTDDTISTPSTGYVPLQGVDWGDVSREVEYSGPRGGLGRVVASSTVADRVVTIPVRVTGASKDNLAVLVSTLVDVVEAIRKNGGRIVRIASGQSVRQYLRVTGSAAFTAQWGQHRRFEVLNRLEGVLTFTCAPYAEGDPMDWVDDFSTNTYGDGRYSVPVGSAGALLAGGGGYITTTSASETQLVHSYTGWRVVDRLQILKFNAPSIIAGGEQVGIVFRWRDANNYLAGIWSTTGFTLRKVIGGVTTTSAVTVTGAPAWAASGRFLFSVYTWGDRITFAAKVDDTGDTIAVADTTPLVGVSSGSVTLTATDARNHSKATGLGGFMMGFLGGSNAQVSWYSEQPFTAMNRLNPGEHHWYDPIPGDMPAACDLHLANTNSTAGTTNIVASGWGVSRLPHNRVGRPNVFGGATGSASGGWRATGGSGIVTAATSLVAATSTTNGWAIHRGNAYGILTCPATAGSGAAYQLPFDIADGERWVAVCWLAANVPTSAMITLGSAANNATSSVISPPNAGAPSIATCVLTGATTNPELGVEVTTATASQLYISNPLVFRGRWGNLSAAINSSVTTMTLDAYPADWPDSTPFDVLCGSEYMSVTGGAGSTSLTVVRGVEGAGPSSHAAGDSVYLLPSYNQRCGYGGHQVGAVVGAWEGHTTVSTDGSGNRYVTAASGSASSGPGARFDTSSAASTVTTGSVEVDVWACVKPDAAAVSPTVRVQALDPLTAVVVASPEYGDLYIPIPVNPWTGTDPVVMRVGTLSLPAGLPSRIELKYLHTSGADLTAYWLMVVPAGGNVSIPVSANVAAFGNVMVDSTLALHHPTVTAIKGSAQGNLVEVPPGMSVLTSRLYGAVSSGSNPVAGTPAVCHLAVTPRWQVLRDA